MKSTNPAPSSHSTRRTFLQTAAVATPTLLATTAAQATSKSVRKSPLPENATILFQGDSITDAGRNRKHAGPNHKLALGNGYPGLIGPELLRDHPSLNLRIFNRGISGHKVPQLDGRWKTDTIDLKPDVLSILIGVNDIWHKLNGRYEGSPALYESGYRALLQRTQKEAPQALIVVCEPFALKCGAVKDNWFPEMDHMRAAAKKVADELQLPFVPFQSMFDEATKRAPAKYWAHDGVHPSLAGHSLMAKTWREVVGI